MLSFDVIGASLVEEYGGVYSLFDEVGGGPLAPISKPQRRTVLHLKVKVGDDGRVTLATGECLTNLGGAVEIFPQTEECQEGDRGIGVMSYLEGLPDHPSVRARYVISVILPPVQFADLVAAARLGRIPSSVTIDQRGMKLPDELSWDWDNKSLPHLQVASVSLSIPLATVETGQESEVWPLARFSPPTQSQSFALEHAVRVPAPVMREISKKLKWLIVLVAALGAIMLFRP